MVTLATALLVDVIAVLRWAERAQRAYDAIDAARACRQRIIDAPLTDELARVRAAVEDALAAPPTDPD